MPTRSTKLTFFLLVWRIRLGLLVCWLLIPFMYPVILVQRLRGVKQMFDIDLSRPIGGLRVNLVECAIGYREAVTDALVNNSGLSVRQAQTAMQRAMGNLGRSTNRIIRILGMEEL